MLKEIIFQLLNYCSANNWAGFDPYDGLNSQILSALPLGKNRLARLFMIQGIKRSPINIRPILMIPKQQNPKGIALFCSALIKLANIGLYHEDRLILSLLDRLLELRSPARSFYCWGYNFPWQNRIILIPRYEPNIIASTFAGNALMDAYERYRDQKFLDSAVSTAHFLLKELNITRAGDDICFSYTPYDQTVIHNANFLGAALLARLYRETKENIFLDYSLKALRFSVNRQNQDGSWFYGADRTQRWIDNFHTGYNLVAINKFKTYVDIVNLENTVQRGYKYYLDHLFTKEGLPKYYHNQLYPIDIHSLSQSLITLIHLEHLDVASLDRAHFIFRWTIANMLDKKGYFYFQIQRLYKNKISYMRWSQAWMLYAMSVFAEKLANANI